MYRKNAWKKHAKKLDKVMDFAEGYKHYISESKTERLAVNEAIKLLEAKGYKDVTRSWAL